MKKQFVRWAFSSALVLGGPAAVHAQQGDVLKWLPLEGASAQSINDKGTKVVGGAYVEGRFTPVEWDVATLVGRPLLPAVDSTVYCGGARDVNNAGVVVGSTANAAGMCQPARWVDGVPSFLSTGHKPGGVASINNAGVALGSLGNGNPYDPLLVLWVGKERVRLPVPYGYFDCFVRSITDRNRVVGFCNEVRTVQWDLKAGTFTEFEGHFTPRAANNQGVILGFSQEEATLGPALIRNGVIEALPKPAGATSSYAYQLNDVGAVVGSFWREGEPSTRAALWSGGVVTDLNDRLDAQTKAAGWILAIARDISNDGKIVGTAFNTQSSTKAEYLLVPSVKARGQR